MKKRFKTRLSFDKDELVGRVSLDHAGMNTSNGVRPKVPFTREELEAICVSFGMFGGSNNSNVYMPDATAESIMPKPEDFIDVPFRLITATTVGAGSWKATNFAKAGVLETSVSKLNAKPVYYDHDTDLMNWVGITKSPKWTQATTNNGIVVPAGIDGIISIDVKTNPKIARGVILQSIFSNSVTVEFEWEMSHVFENKYDFEDKVGGIASDGRMITRNVTKILDYHETSLVWLGADPFAKLIGANGELVNIDTGSVHYKKVEDEKEAYKAGKNYYTFGLDKNIVHLSKFNQQNKQTMNKELEAALRILLGVEVETELSVSTLDRLMLKPATPAVAITAEQLAKIASYDALKYVRSLGVDGVVLDFADSLGNDAQKSNFTVVQSEYLTKLQAAQTKCITLASDNVSLTKDAVIGKQYTKMKRDEVIRQYKLVTGDAQDASVLTLMEGADSEALNGLLKQYTKGTTEKFSGKCKSCGSDEFEFRSTFVPDGAPKPVKASSFDDIYAKFGGNGKMNISKK